MTDADTFTMLPAARLRVGMMVDLQDDRYADDGTDPGLKYEYATVIEESVRETPTCVLVHFDTGSVGMPPEHPLRVVVP